MIQWAPAVLECSKLSTAQQWWPAISLLPIIAKSWKSGRPKPCRFKTCGFVDSVGCFSDVLAFWKSSFNNHDLNVTLVYFLLAEDLSRTTPQLLSIDVNYIANFKEPQHQVASCSSASCCAVSWEFVKKRRQTSAIWAQPPKDIVAGSTSSDWCCSSCKTWMGSCNICRNVPWWCYVVLRVAARQPCLGMVSGQWACLWLGCTVPPTL